MTVSYFFSLIIVKILCNGREGGGGTGGGVCLKLFALLVCKNIAESVCPRNKHLCYHTVNDNYLFLCIFIPRFVASWIINAKYL